jgi:hypothetical protein
MKYKNSFVGSFFQIFGSRLTLIRVSIYFSFLGLCVLGSCQKIQRRMLGISDPNDYITKSEAIDFGTHYGFDPTTIVFTKDADSALINEMKYFGAPALHIFNKQGGLIKYKEDSQDCRAGADDFLTMLDPSVVYETNQSKDQKLIWKYLEDKGPSYIDHNADFYVYITWSKWLGKGITEENAGAWVSAIKKNDKARIQVILINIDRIK